MESVKCTEPRSGLPFKHFNHCRISAGYDPTSLQHIWIRQGLSFPKKRCWEWWDPLSKVCIEDFQDMKVNLKHLQKELDAQAHHFAVNLDIAGFSVNDLLASACNELIVWWQWWNANRKPWGFEASKRHFVKIQGGKRINEAKDSDENWW